MPAIGFFLFYWLCSRSESEHAGKGVHQGVYQGVYQGYPKGVHHAMSRYVTLCMLKPLNDNYPQA